MRVGIDTQSTVGQRTGIGCYTACLLQAMRELASGVEFVELSIPDAGPMRTDRRVWWQQVTLPAMARRVGADLLHVTGFDAPARAPCPVVLTVHDLIGMMLPAHLPTVSRIYWSRWLPRSVRWADRIIAPSEYTKSDVVRLLAVPPERITVVHEGVSSRFRRVDDAARLAGVRARYGLDAPFILYVGTVEPRKGIKTLVSAFECIAQGVSHDLVIAGGKGWGMDAFVAGVRLSVFGSRIRFTDYVSDDDLVALYTMADLFVLPSDYEGFGLPVLEAMACGVPAIVTTSSSLPEVAGAAACLVPPGDPTVLAGEIERVLADKALRAAMSERGLRRAAQFTWQEAARRTVAVYREALA
jgi:glycosyltransferase involved in cell wall biosynthesis